MWISHLVKYLAKTEFPGNKLIHHARPDFDLARIICDFTTVFYQGKWANEK